MRIYLLFCYFILPVMLSAAETEYRVVYVNGDITVQKEDGSTNTLDENQLLQQTDTVILKKNSSFSFKHKNNYFSFSQPGNHDIASIKKNAVSEFHHSEMLFPLRRGMPLNEDDQEIIVRTRGFRDEGRYEVYIDLLADRDYDLIVERLRSPLNAPEFYYKGRALLHMGQLQDAVSNLEKAVQKKPSEKALIKEIYSTLAFSLYRLDKFDQVENCFQRTKQLITQKQIPAELWVLSVMAMDKKSTKRAQRRARMFQSYYPNHNLLQKVKPFL